MSGHTLRLTRRACVAASTSRIWSKVNSVLYLPLSLMPARRTTRRKPENLWVRADFGKSFNKDTCLPLSLSWSQYHRNVLACSPVACRRAFSAFAKRMFAPTHLLFKSLRVHVDDFGSRNGRLRWPSRPAAAAGAGCWSGSESWNSCMRSSGAAAGACA